MKSIFILVSLFVLATVTNTADAATTTKATVLTQAQSEAKVREYFKDTPVMIEIARCESNFRQFTDSGSVLRGGSAAGMVGIFQFFESIHAPIAKKLGFDLVTVEGNLGYAKHVHATEGTTPWSSARDCWDTKQTMTTPAPATKEKLQQQIIILKKLIALLQKQLEARQR
jgi:hypothetical protein